VNPTLTPSWVYGIRSDNQLQSDRDSERPELKKPPTE